MIMSMNPTSAASAAECVSRPQKVPSGVLSKDVQKLISKFVMALKRNEIRGSSTVALETITLLLKIIERGKFATVKDLLDVVREVGRTLTTERPVELTMGNVVRRVMFIIRHELAASLKKTAGNNSQEETIDLSRSLHKLLDNEDEFDYSKDIKLLKEPIITAMMEMQDDIKNFHDSIGDLAEVHVHARETILTFGFSKTVAAFLTRAAAHRKFEVLVAESAPSFEGQRMAVHLSKLGIETTVITDSAVFAMMRTVNKVIIGPHSVMANGGVITHSGGQNIAVAAKHHSVPFVVVSGMYKLCPLFAFDQDTFNVHNAPSQILNFQDPGSVSVAVENPAYDYISPDLVTLFVTNIGGHNPSYIYRLLNEFYYPQDYDL